jgi:hypothetical protein
MKRFHGVETKYLENYLVWFRFLDTNENSSKKYLFKAQQHLAGRGHRKKIKRQI